MMVPASAMTCLNCSTDRGPMSSPIFWSGTDLVGQGSTWTSRLRVDPTTWSTGRNTFNTCQTGFLEQLLSEAHFVLFHQRFAASDSLGPQECEGHAATNQESAREWKK